MNELEGELFSGIESTHTPVVGSTKEDEVASSSDSDEWYMWLLYIVVGPPVLAYKLVEFIWLKAIVPTSEWLWYDVPPFIWTWGFKEPFKFTF